MRFGRWEVVDQLPGVEWLCRCNCGHEKLVSQYSLKKGKSNSCGCLKRELIHPNLSHGHARKLKQSGTYKSWAEMIARCTNRKSRIYSYYGGRGIKVCERWLKFEDFLGDMGGRPDGRSLDRVDNDGNYEPGNCRWATRRQQARNRRSNHLIQYRGKNVCLAELAESAGLPDWKVRQRIRRGWSIEKALGV